MMDKSVRNIKESWRDLYSILLTTVMISAGISLLILGIGNIIGNAGNILYIICGAILIICPLIIVFIINFSKSSRKYIINAVITYNREDKELINIKNYDFMEDLCRHMKSAILEDENIQSMWKKECLDVTGVIKKSDNEEEYVKVSRSAAILNQLIEYLLIKKLGLVTSAYFNAPKIDKKRINQIERSDINDFVANNIFINLFTKPTYERVAFDNKELESNVVYCYGKNKAIYDKFELLLPQKCKFKKTGNEIIIKHPYFCLTITTAFTGFSEVLPRGFAERYMKCDWKIRSYKVWIGIKLKFSWRAIFMNKTQYYDWIDKYIEELEKYASFEYFKETIQWNVTNALLDCLDNNK